MSGNHKINSGMEKQIEPYEAYTFAIRTSLVTSQSLQKSMLIQTLIENKKSPPLMKKNTLPTHNPPNENELTKFTENKKGMALHKKEGQPVTRYIKNWTVTTEIKGCKSLQTLFRFDNEVLRSAQLFIYRNRCKTCQKKKK